MNITTKQHKATHQGRVHHMLLFLLLLMMAGAQGAWAVETVYGSVFYKQDYEADGIGAGWTTSVSGRYNPTILEEGDNHFMAGNPEQTYNNGALLTGPAISVKTTEKFVLSFDLRLRKSNSDNNKPEFYITNYGGYKFFSLVAKDGTNNTTWTLNNSTDITLDGTTYVNNEIVSDLNWFRFKVIWDGTDMSVEITNKSTNFSTSTSVLAKTTISRLHTGGGIGRMQFATGKSLAKFAIDNICVTSLLSYSSEEATIDITAVGTTDRPDVSSQMPSLINEVSGSVTETAYSSSDMSVARVTDAGEIYLLKPGTTSIGIKKRIDGTDYKSNFELTVTGSVTTTNTWSTPDGLNTKAGWEVTGGGTVTSPVEVGPVTMTSSFGTATTISVYDDDYYTGGYVTKTIRTDDDMYGSAAVNTTGDLLHEDNSGGTFYKFTLAKAGKFDVWGTGTPILLSSTSTTSTVSASTTGTHTAAWDNLAAGTYYLYGIKLHSFQHTYVTPTIEWSANSATVNIMDVGITNPNVVTGLPTLTLGTANTEKNDDGYVKGYKSSNTAVATFFSGDDAGKVHIRGTGVTTIKVIDGSGNTAEYTLTVTGTSVAHRYIDNKTLSFDDVGVLKNSTDNPGNISQTLSTGLTIDYGYTGETSIVTEYDGMTVMKIIDGNGYSHPNLTVSDYIPPYDANGGTYVRLKATTGGYLIVTGNVEAGTTKIYRYGNDGDNVYDVTQHAVFDAEAHTMSVSLEANGEGNDYYYLYNTNPNDGTYTPPVHSITYVPGFFANSYMVTALPTGGGDVTINNILYGITTPDYTIEAKVGDISSDSPTITGTTENCTISGITKSGVLKITATQHEGTASATYYLTVAYPANPGKFWNFNDGNSIHSITTVPTPTTTDGDWTAKYKNMNNNREPRWFYNKAVAGDNAFVIEKTAGLIFETSAGGFYMRNDGEIWHHVGIHRQKASFTIPLLKAGDIVELNWKRDAESSGANFSATNVKDLRGKSVDEIFNITGSRNKYRDGVNIDQGGLTSFEVAQDGDVKFTMEDTGYNDLLSVRIYSGGYRPTMSTINQFDGGAGITPPETILLDNAKQSVTLNYCNLLNSTATGPAMYVLKGYRSGTDNIECVTGTDSKKPGSNFSDDDAYPVSSAEQDFLYEQRKNLVGFRMYNDPWSSSNNSYNNGVIEATSGYGKVTVRMNNYTNDLKYVIGYTPDYTLTFGSAPHQTYPYTWNFENISGGAVKGRSNNAYNSISSDYLTWTYLGYETYQLNTSTAGGSLYVPGAVLVTDARSLGERGEASTLNAAGYGCDELNGLGFSGQFTFKLAQQGSTANDAPTYTTENPWNPGTPNSLLEYSFNYTSGSVADDAYMAQRFSANDKTTWTPADLTAGDGKVMFGSPGKREDPASGVTITSGANFVYKMDGGNSKNVLLMPQRPLKNGDQIILKGYSSASVQESGFSFYAAANDASANDLVTIYWPEGTAANTETTLTYTVTAGDGLSGRSEVYLFRANKAKTVYLTSIAIAGNDTSAPTAYERALTCNGSVTVTIPDLVAGHYVYIKSSNKPTTPESLTEVTESNKEAYGHDADTGVYEYIVNNAGNADVTFSDSTKIYAIGVTGILKQLKRVGDGDAWATESRNHAIDYTQTDTFTVNNIVANTVSAKSYTTQKVIVQLNEQTYAMPAETGLVLKLKMKYSEGDAGGTGEGGTMTDAEAATATTNAAMNFGKTKSYDGTAGTGKVPLFYPPHSATVLSSNTVGFGGSQGNLLYRNLADTTFTTETKTIGTTEYVPFIFAYKYMKWQKVNEGTAAPTNSTAFLEGTVPVFYRLHVYDSTEAGALSPSEATLNTLAANKAYMLIRSGNVPDALWDSSSGGAKGYIGISGISDFTDYSEYSDYSKKPAKSGTYNMSGQKMSDEVPLPAGIYIKDGRKIVVH